MSDQITSIEMRVIQLFVLLLANDILDFLLVCFNTSSMRLRGGWLRLNFGLVNNTLFLEILPVI